jgi:hypothetical protein
MGHTPTFHVLILTNLPPDIKGHGQDVLLLGQPWKASPRLRVPLWSCVSMWQLQQERCKWEPLHWLRIVITWWSPEVPPQHPPGTGQPCLDRKGGTRCPSWHDFRASHQLRFPLGMALILSPLSTTAVISFSVCDLKLGFPLHLITANLFAASSVFWLVFLPSVSFLWKPP